MQRKFKTLSATATEELASSIGANLVGGECIEFISDLGGGKTTFVKGLVLGCGSKDNVSSPTFTIYKKYRAESFYIYHYDLYRLGKAGLVAEELSEVLEDKSNVFLIEWGQSVLDILPVSRIRITIDKVASDADARLLKFDYPYSLDYVLEGI